MWLRIDGLLKVVGAGVPLLNVTFEEVGLKSQCRREDLLKLRLEIGSLATPLTGARGTVSGPNRYRMSRIPPPNCQAGAV